MEHLVAFWKIQDLGYDPDALSISGYERLFCQR
jgi:hypothetical protein